MDGLLEFEMSRSINRVNSKLFEKLFDYTDQSKENENRYIPISSNLEERRLFTNFLKQGTILHPTLNSVFSIFKLDDDYFLVFVGNLETDFNSAELLPQIVSKEMYLAILDELAIPIKKEVSKESILEYLAIGIEMDQYSGHDFEELKRFFPDINVYKVVSSIIDFSNHIYRYAIYYFCNNPDYNILPFSQSTLRCIESTNSILVNLVPLDNLLRGLTASSWMHCFLDLYKYIEYLFEIAKVHEHFKEFEKESIISFEDFHHKINNILNKEKPKEDTAIQYLFSMIEDRHKDIIRSYKNGPEEKEAKFIYKLRNDLVHFRKDTISCNTNFNNEKWNAIISFILEIISSLYNRFASVV